MQRYDLLYDQIYDLVGFRVIVDTVTDCYAALGVVHANWKPVPGRFKDYIALPKNNLYQSLHTTVIGAPGRTSRGADPHPRDAPRRRSSASPRTGATRRARRPGNSEAQRFAWLRQLLEWQQNLSDPHEFLGSIKEDLFSDEVFVFTPAGRRAQFPRGRDGDRLRLPDPLGSRPTLRRRAGQWPPGAAPLRAAATATTVEIVTTANQTPSKDWLSMVKTSRAKTRIRGWLKYQRAQPHPGGRE